MLSDPERRATYDRYGRDGLRGGGFTPGRLRPRQPLGHLRRLLRRVALRAAGAPRRADAAAATSARAAEISLAEAFSGHLRQRARRASPRRARRAAATAPRRARRPVTCDVCGGAGRVQQVSQSVFGQFVRTGACPRCEGLGRVVESPCEHVRRASAARCTTARSTSTSRPASTTASASASAAKGTPASSAGPAGDLFVQVRRAPAARHRARRRRPPHGRRADDDAGGARRVGHRPRARPARSRSRSRRAPSRATSRCSAARACRRSRDGGAGDFHVHARVHVPRRLDDEQRALVEQLGEALGEDRTATTRTTAASSGGSRTRSADDACDPGTAAAPLDGPTLSRNDLVRVDRCDDPVRTRPRLRGGGGASAVALDLPAASRSRRTTTRSRSCSTSEERVERDPSRVRRRRRHAGRSRAGRTPGARFIARSAPAGSGSGRRGSSPTRRARRRDRPGSSVRDGRPPTTRLCIELLATSERGSLLDVGCGSGVLSIAAARLGFDPILAVDNDPGRGRDDDRERRGQRRRASTRARARRRGRRRSRAPTSPSRTCCSLRSSRILRPARRAVRRSPPATWRRAIARRRRAGGTARAARARRLGGGPVRVRPLRQDSARTCRPRGSR